jgi:hypothetical protein
MLDYNGRGKLCEKDFGVGSGPKMTERREWYSKIWFGDEVWGQWGYIGNDYDGMMMKILLLVKMILMKNNEWLENTLAS